MPAGVDSMAYAGEPAWHRIGTKFDGVGLMTASEAMRLAGLDYDVYSCPLRLATSDTLVTDFVANVRREKNGTETILGVVSPEYRILQNSDAFKFFDAVCMDPNGPKYEVAGSLWGGKRIWMLAKIPSFIDIKHSSDDVVNAYLLLSNSHDGKRAVDIMLTPVRVVCQNTLSLAYSKRGIDQSDVLQGDVTGAGWMRIRHTGDMESKVEAAQDALGFVRHKLERLGGLYNDMAVTDVMPEDARWTLNRLLGIKVLDEDGQVEETVMTAQRATAVNEIMDLWDQGTGNTDPKIHGTAWTLYNAVVEWADYHKTVRPRTHSEDHARVSSNWFGASRDIKVKALPAILTL